ncbi:Galactose-1-phosphate uridylyltransferase [hydrothermal vent metagenome]|uniref:Galactose-1-phosphate uridylyltransferase n=1 Tax=hydrothermal vent metagenome TaxID=652676 RepID=A0A3B1AHM2_9ZZZZ
MQSDEKNLREIRINPIIPSESVLVATARSMRPQKDEQAAPRDTREHVSKCPFCTGNESMTPPEIASYPNSQDWHIRIVENLYPVLGDDRNTPMPTFGLQQAIEGYGRHEVIVDHTQHGIAIHEMSVEHLSLLFLAYKDRVQQIYDMDDRLKYVLVFKNFGPAAGASMSHTHSQIIALPVVPQNVHDELHHSKLYYDKNHKCIFCCLIDEALTFETTIYERDTGKVLRKINVGQYVIERSEFFIAIKPFASRYEWEVQILPLSHSSDFLSLTQEQSLDFAKILKNTMTRLDAVIGGAQYNYFLHSLPHGGEYTDSTQSYHWHLEICPRTSIPSGFELGSGLFVNTISPEDAAEQLRNAKI